MTRKSPPFAELVPYVEECRRRREALNTLQKRKSEHPVLLREAQTAAREAGEKHAALVAAQSARQLAGGTGPADEQLERGGRELQVAQSAVAALENDARGFDGALEMLRTDLSAAHDALSIAITTSTSEIRKEMIAAYRRAMQDLKDSATVLDSLAGLHTPRCTIIINVPSPDGHGHVFATLPPSPEAVQLVNDISPAKRAADRALQALLR